MTKQSETGETPSTDTENKLECMGRFKHKFEWMPDQLLERKRCRTCGMTIRVDPKNRFKGQ